MKKDRRILYLIASTFACFALVSFAVSYFKHDYFRHWAYVQKIVYSEKKVFDGEVEPEIPEHNNDTILGVDSNKNGIRDDVDIWINRYGKSFNERMAMRQYAKAFQNVLNILVYRQNIPNALTKLSLAHDCINFMITTEKKFRLFKVDEAIEYLYLNTKSREKLYSSLEEKTFSYETGDSDWHKHCEFQVENYNQVFARYQEYWRRK